MYYESTSAEPSGSRRRRGRGSESGGRGSGSGGRAPASSHSTHIADTEIPSGSAAPSEHMSIEDFVAQPGREKLTRLHPDMVGRDRWFGDTQSKIPASINRMMGCLLRHPYKTFYSMPLADQEMWLRQFAQDYTWDPQMTGRVRRAFGSQASRSYSIKMNEWKQKWNEKKVPKELQHNPTLWNGLIAYWNEETTKADSETHSTNRKSHRQGKGVSTHNLGAKSKLTRVKELTRDLGREPTHLEVIAATHTNKYSKEIQDPVARGIFDDVTRMQEEYILTQSSEGSVPEVPYDKINEFVLQVTPQSRGRVFGLPDDAASSGSSWYSNSSPYLTEQLAERDATIASLQARIDEEAVRTKKNEERLERLEAMMSQSRSPPYF